MSSKRRHFAEGTCPHCGATAFDHRHSLTSGIVSGLLKLYANKGLMPARLSTVIKNRSVIDNFQKLSYWGLVSKNCWVMDENGKPRVSGVWQVTEQGREFLLGRARMPRRLWTFRGQFLEWDQPVEYVSPADVDPGFLEREDYVAVMRPHEEE